MKFGFSSSVCPQWDLETLIARAAALGYGGVELCGLLGEMHLPASSALAGNGEAVAAKFGEAGVELVCLAAESDFAAKDRRRIARETARVREVIELAGRLGCPFVRVLGGDLPRYDSRKHALIRVADVLADLAPVAAHHGTTLVLENRGAVAGSRDVWSVLETVDHPALRGGWNPCEAQAAGERPGLAVPRLGTRIALTHLADATFTEDGRLDRSAPPGGGSMDFELFLDRLRGVGYAGYLMIDRPIHRSAEWADPEQSLPAALAYLQGLAEKLASIKPLTAYKGDKRAVKFASPAPSPAASA